MIVVFTDEQVMFIATQKEIYSWNKLAEHFNERFGTQYSVEKIRSFARRHIYNSRKGAPKKESVTSVAIKENGDQLSQIKIAMTTEQMKDQKFLLKAHGYDPDKWVIKNAINNLWEMGSANSKPQQLYQSKITVAPKKNDELTTEEIIKALVAETKPIAFGCKEAKQIISNSCMVINLADLHFGILKEDESLRKLCAKLCMACNTTTCGEIHINLLGDLFHSDSMVLGTTTKGTRIDDVNMVQAIEEAKKFIEPIIIEACKCSDNVHVNMVAGNHDLSIGYMFGEYLKARFCNDVVFNVGLQHRTAIVINDNVMMCLAHGDLARKNLPMIFATEYPKEWGMCKERVCFVGHLHQQKKEVTAPVEDKNGMTIYQQPTIKPNDYYEIKNGYTMSKKMIQIYLFRDGKVSGIAHYYKE